MKKVKKQHIGSVFNCPEGRFVLTESLPKQHLTTVLNYNPDLLEDVSKATKEAAKPKG